VLAYFAAVLHSQTTHQNSYFPEKGFIFTNPHRTRLSEKTMPQPTSHWPDRTQALLLTTNLS